MELQVTLTLSDRLFALLEDKLPNLGRRIEKALTKELGAQARRESSIAVSVNATADMPGTALEEEARTAPQPEAPAAVAEAAAQPEKTTGEIIREIMHRTRQRFEGEEYKENTGSEGYQKYHKQLTRMFKQISVALGADKPSMLTAEKAEAFAAECDALVIDEKGFIAPSPAPF